MNLREVKCSCGSAECPDLPSPPHADDCAKVLGSLAHQWRSDYMRVADAIAPSSENAHDLADKVRNIRRERDEFSDALVELHGEHEALSALVREYKEAQADYDNNLMTRDGLGHDRVQRIQRAQSALLLRGTP